MMLPSALGGGSGGSGGSEGSGGGGGGVPAFEREREGGGGGGKMPKLGINSNIYSIYQNRGQGVVAISPDVTISSMASLSRRSRFFPVLWIRIRIGSVFRSFLYPDQSGPTHVNTVPV